MGERKKGKDETDEHLIESNKNKCFSHCSMDRMASHHVNILYIFDGGSHYFLDPIGLRIYTLTLFVHNQASSFKPRRYCRDNFNSNDNKTTNAPMFSIQSEFYYFAQFLLFWWSPNTSGQCNRCNSISIHFLFI